MLPLPLLYGLTLVQAKPRLPHVLLILADDLGWANGKRLCVQLNESVLRFDVLKICQKFSSNACTHTVGWHRKGDNKTPEVQTPQLDELVSEGIELNRFYAYHMCSPTRSSLQTGRLPLHVNIVNSNPTIYNASSFTGTGAGIPRNMSTIAGKMKKAGYHTVMAGTLSI